MHPILFDFFGINIYSYGFFIAVGAIAGVAYMAVRGKKDVGLTFDQANSLFLVIFLAAFVGGKVFLFFEDISFIHNILADWWRVGDSYFTGHFCSLYPQ